VAAGLIFAYLPLARSGSQFVEDGAETVGLKAESLPQPRANLVEEKCAIDVRDVRSSAWLPAMKATTIHTSEPYTRYTCIWLGCLALQCAEGMGDLAKGSHDA
jgi:hypothetical protein